MLGAGLGGGSLIYANVFLEPPNAVFGDRWPQSCRQAQLLPYYRVCKEVLGARPIPPMQGRRHIVRTELFEKVAQQTGRESRRVDINVFFGNDFDDPLPPGVQATNRYGALQTSCTYCGECDVGCNYQAKNTLDLNYLYRAEHKYGAKIRAEHFVDRIVPVGRGGQEDHNASGEFRYRVYYRDVAQAGTELCAHASRVVVSGGSLGSTELLLRCRDVFRTLPHISRSLGAAFPPTEIFSVSSPAAAYRPIPITALSSRKQSISISSSISPPTMPSFCKMQAIRVPRLVRREIKALLPAS